MSEDGITAFGAAKVAQVTLAQDDKVAVFGFETEDGTPFNVAIPSDQLAHMLYLASAADKKARLGDRGPDNRKLTYPVEWWEIGDTPQDPSQVLMSFRMEGGGEMTFRLHRDSALHYRNVLTNLLEPGSLSEDHSGTPKH